MQVLMQWTVNENSGQKLGCYKQATPSTVCKCCSVNTLLLCSVRQTQCGGWGQGYWTWMDQCNVGIKMERQFYWKGQGVMSSPQKKRLAILMNPPILCTILTKHDVWIMKHEQGHSMIEEWCYVHKLLWHTATQTGACHSTENPRISCTLRQPVY